MIINSAEFHTSFNSLVKMPNLGVPEYAFLGRSNVGKSSLINMLTGVKNLARTSSTPGKTQLINFYKINNAFYFVDLPGYGYASASKTSRARWNKLTMSYLQKRATLVCLFLLLDGRHPLQRIDKEWLIWLGENAIPFSLVLTKTDKLKPTELTRNLAGILKSLEDTWESLPDILMASSVKKSGKKEMLDYIDRLNQELPKT
jgi:GTP-binding protein